MVERGGWNGEEIEGVVILDGMGNTSYIFLFIIIVITAVVHMQCRENALLVHHTRNPHVSADPGISISPLGYGKKAIHKPTRCDRGMLTRHITAKQIRQSDGGADNPLFTVRVLSRSSILNRSRSLTLRCQIIILVTPPLPVA